MVWFSLIVTIILLFLCGSIYYFSATYRKAEFYSRLENKAVTTARLLLDISEVDSILLKIIEKNSGLILYNEVVAVFDNQDRKIYCSLDNDTLHVTKKFLDEVRLEKKVKYLQGKNEAVGLLYREGPRRYVVIAMAYDLYGRNKLRFLSWILLAGFLGSIFVSVFTGRLFAARALKPIADMVTQVDRITFENLDQRLDEGNRTDEISRLAITFNRMLDRLVSAVAMQKSFVSNASHELRTPLTSITGQIEVALMKTRPVKEYQAILNSIMEDIRNLNALSNGLLDMAKVSPDTSGITMQAVRIDEILLEVYAELTAGNPSYTLSIQFEEQIEEDKDLTVRGNQQLLKSALYNLAHNGCKFSDDHSVDVHFSARMGKVILKFTDKGIGIPEEEAGKILDPFYRARNTHSIPGIGLGLSLTNRIITLHKGELLVDSQPGKGTTVTVVLPVSR